MECLRIEKLENGFKVEVCDPKIRAANEKSKGMWKDPWKQYAFSTAAEVTTFVTKHLEALPKSDKEQFDEAYNEATKE